MKKGIKFLSIAALLLITMACFTGCGKNYKIQVSTNDLWFNVNAGTQTLEITANCDWTITKNNDADWYSINMMSGKNDATLTISVEAMEDSDYRGASFVINSPGGHVHRTIFVTQNKLDFDGLVNKIFGVMELEHWNTDYYGQIIEDSYKFYEFDPYDTTTGYLMYFLENGQGVQRDHHRDTAVYYAFTYDYNPVDQILHIEFETVDDAPESYDPQVLAASDSLYRFIHEYKPNWWERADMRKVGVFDPDRKADLRQKAIKRKNGEGIFGF
jgi:hypothetical protein